MGVEFAMKLKLLIVAMLIIAVVLLAPLSGFGAYKDGEVGITIDVKAYRSSATDMVGASSIAVSYSDPHEVSYLDYFGIWWGGVFRTGDVTVYPEIQVYIILTTDVGQSDWERRVLNYGYDYTYGERWSHTYKVNADQGTKIEVQVWVVSQPTEFLRTVFYGVVP